MLFQKDPLKTLQRDLDAAISKRDAIRVRLDGAENAVIAATASAQQLAVALADDDKLSAAEDKLRAAERRVQTQRDALTEVEATVAKQEAELATAQDAKLRRETASTVEKMADDLEATATAFDPVIAKMIDVTERSKTFLWEANGLNEFATVCEMQIPEATRLLATLLRSHAQSVLNGAAPATLARPPEPFVEPVVTEPATVELFTLRSIKWTNDGVQRIAGQYQDCHLPPPLAARALACRACVPVTDERRARLRGVNGSHPDARHAYDLDAPEPAAVSDAIHSAFEAPVVGKPFLVRTERSAP